MFWGSGTNEIEFEIEDTEEQKVPVNVMNFIQKIF